MSPIWPSFLAAFAAVLTFGAATALMLAERACHTVVAEGAKAGGAR